ncbi:tetratricopeptide repeat protein [Pseudoponticoccus marisrubri]|uniref:Cell division coordinator CpoB n=1 Tax=Pseudoponticoccus marisrubri TaxID=1685382 RepID=A0A0W7WGR8_9RHOB|nr:tetratricopeptide repeat protein [Pseudoponticoccus marisrubri]KUF09820.1 tol-pal system protein [Pseudoponticoccus marisrubri]
MRILLALVLMLGSAAQAQDVETLADIRQDLSVLSVELRKLKQELNTTGASEVAVGGSTLDRINVIESELQRITAKTEELEYRIGRVVEDGTNRIGDLTFRLCELEAECDIAELGSAPPLGGDAVPAPAPAAPAPQASTDALPVEGELAVSEEADFRAAQDALELGDYQGAAQLFAQFRESYPMGPLEPAALVGEGRALEGLEDTREAARRYLDAYSNFPDARVAPEALWRLGEMLGALGSVTEACVALGEVGARYPDSDYVARARSSWQALGCE